jgi:PAS domain S-box-containing protein
MEMIMTLGNRLTRFPEEMRITTRLGVGVGILVFLILAVAATGYLSIRFVRKAEASIQVSREIQRMVLDMDRGMEKARRLHGNFFLHYPEIGLARAHEHYAQPSVRQVARVITLSHALKQKIARSEVDRALRERHVDLNLYLSSAKRFGDTSIQAVEWVTELAAPEWGLEAVMENRYQALRVEMAGHEALKRFLREIRSFAQDYRITRKRFLMQSAFNAAFRLRSAVENVPNLSDARRERLITLLDQWKTAAEKMLDADVAIKSKFHDFALQAEAVEPISTALIALAGEAVERDQVRIDRTLRAAFFIVAAVTLTGMILAVCIAGMLNRSITRRVVRLTRSAEALRAGHLDVHIEEEGKDELSRLARTFNFMTTRLRELIDHLEQKVERRTAELAESERRFRQLFEYSGSGVAVCRAVENGADFIFRDVNRAVERIEHVSRGEIIGKKVTEVFPGFQEFGLLEVFQQVWRTGLSRRHPLRFYSDDRRSGWRQSTVYKLPSGEIVNVYDDLTAQKQAELEKSAMEAKLQRAQKMEAIGLLAGGVAHDLNNILSGIVGYPELLLMQLPQDSKLRGPIRAIQESGQRAVAVVADLLTVARGVASVKNVADLNVLVREHLDSPEHKKLLSRFETVDFRVELDSRLPAIRCSSVHIKKCLMNLLTNAMEAVDGDGRIVVSTGCRRLDETNGWKVDLEPGEYAVLRVADNGTGIPETDLEHIFEPFYTKKVMGLSGTGLGLAVVWNSMQDHGGAVEVESDSGGTAFNLYFPVSREAVELRPRSSEIEDLRGRGEKILIVDDEPQQLDIAERMLRMLGYTVACAGSGEAAEAFFRERTADLVLLDMIMAPGINGRETYERILRIRPGQKAVIASGFSETEDVEAARRLGAGGFIKKPYSMTQLGRAVQQAFRGNESSGSEMFHGDRAASPATVPGGSSGTEKFPRGFRPSRLKSG